MIVLLFREANLNQVTSYGQTPIMAAAVNGHVDIVKYLADQKAELDVKDKNEIGRAHV